MIEPTLEIREPVVLIRQDCQQSERPWCQRQWERWNQTNRGQNRPARSLRPPGFSWEQKHHGDQNRHCQQHPLQPSRNKQGNGCRHQRLHLFCPARSRRTHSSRDRMNHQASGLQCYPARIRRTQPSQGRMIHQASGQHGAHGQQKHRKEGPCGGESLEITATSPEPLVAAATRPQIPTCGHLHHCGAGTVGDPHCQKHAQ